MATKLNLYNDGIDPIGTATFNKAKNGYIVTFTEEVYFDDRFVPYEEFETFKANMGLNSMSGTQVTLKDFLL